MPTPIDILRDVSPALAELHRLTMDAVRKNYESVHGRLSPNDLLRLLLNDPLFQWLRPLSGELAEIDHRVAKRTADAVFLQEVRGRFAALFVEGSDFSKNFAAVANPEVIEAKGRFEAALFHEAVRH
jgi:hypothetical protein